MVAVCKSLVSAYLCNGTHIVRGRVVVYYWWETSVSWVVDIFDVSSIKVVVSILGLNFVITLWFRARLLGRKRASGRVFDGW